MRILIATKNRGKFGEIAGFLAGLPGVELEFLGDREVDDTDFIEDGATHEENAAKKARYYWERLGGGGGSQPDGVRRIEGVEGAVAAGAAGAVAAGAAGGGVGTVVGLPGQTFNFVLGEDSGIYVDALGDELGVQTRRWGAGEKASDEEWLAHFMREMDKLAPTDERRGAKFVCHACLKGRGIEASFDGETFGRITQDISCAVLPGLPLSSVFKPDGFDQVYAELGRDKKNEISHRGQAIAKVKEFLEKLFN